MDASRLLIVAFASMACACASVRVNPVSSPDQFRTPSGPHLTVYDESGQRYLIQPKSEAADPALTEAIRTLARINGDGRSPCLYLPNVGSLQTAPSLQAKVEALARQLEDSEDKYDSQLGDLRDLFVELHAAQEDDYTRSALLALGWNAYPQVVRGLTARQLAYVLADYATEEARLRSLHQVWPHTQLAKTRPLILSEPEFYIEDAQAILAAFSSAAGKTQAYAVIRDRIEDDFGRLTKGRGAARQELDQEVYETIRPTLVEGVPKGATEAERVALAKEKVGVLSAVPRPVLAKVDDETRDAILASLSHPSTQQEWVKAYAALVTSR